MAWTAATVLVAAAASAIALLTVVAATTDQSPATKALLIRIGFADACQNDPIDA